MNAEYDAFVDQIGAEMVAALDHDKRMIDPPTRKPSHYSPQLLEMARQMESDGGERILNPRDLSVRSLLLADQDWINDKALHSQWVRWKYDQKRPKPPK